MSEHPIFSKKESFLLWILFTAIWTYLWLKTLMAPMSHDEIATFFYYIQNHSFLPFFTQADANNHVLNSALTTLSYTLFGDAPLALRLPSLLMFIPYFYFTVKISTQIKNLIIRWAFILTLITSAGMIEFFALSRGYGMSMALLLGCIYYLMRGFRTNKTAHYLICLFLALMALLANLTLLVSFLIIFAWLILFQFLRYQAGIKRNILLLTGYLFMAIIPLGLFLKYIFLLQNTGALYYGSLSGFWQLSVHSISFMFTGLSGPFFPFLFLGWFIIMMIFFMVILFSVKIRSLIFDAQMIFWVLLCGNIAAIIFMGKVMKVNYPEDRTGLYLFPFFVGSLCFLSDKLLQQWNKKWLLVVLLPLLFFPINLLVSANFGRSNIYLQDRFPQRFFDAVYAQHAQGEFPASVGGNSVKLFCWTFFNYRKDGSLGPVHFWNNPSHDEEFQIVMPDEIPSWRTYYDSIDCDKYSGLLLLKRKIAYHKHLLKVDDVAAATKKPQEYLNLTETDVDSLAGKTLYMGYKLSINTAAAPFNARVVIDICDSNGKSLTYEYISLNWLKLHYQSPDINFLNGMLIPKLPPEAAKIKTYIWNLSKVPFSVKGKVFLFEMWE